MGSIHGLEKHDAERTAVYRKVAMEKTIVQNYDELYALQDRVLGLVFSEETPFYLTGGNCTPSLLLQCTLFRRDPSFENGLRI